MDHDVKDLALADAGKARIEWADRDMPVLASIRERFATERPLEGLRVSACLHVTTETANLVRTLKAGGAEVTLCASNPLSTQDDVAAALVAEYGISTFARHGADRDTYYRHLSAAADTRPHMTMDDGCDLVTLIHQERRGQLSEIVAGTEETTTGDIHVIRAEHFKAMHDGAIMANSGHFDVEIDIPALSELAAGRIREVRTNVVEYDLGDRRVHILAEGRLVNLSAAEGHPAAVMDMSFANQALAAEWLLGHHKDLVKGVYDVPTEIDVEVARLKLAAMGIAVSY